VSIRRPPLSHPLAPVLDRAVDSLSAALNPDTTRHYRGTVRKFLTYLGAVHPEVRSLDQLRRDPHLLGWMSCLRSQMPPLATASCSNLLIHLRSIFQELALSPQTHHSLKSGSDWPVMAEITEVNRQRTAMRVTSTAMPTTRHGERRAVIRWLAAGVSFPVAG